ncbi:MAG TPA: rod shape-determining protein MreC [Burkholderiales bacterium]|nr:rod shape-determining protein MreC [Burkholderiales bacterium]
MEATPPDFFKRGPSLFARFLFFAILAVVLIAADARYAVVSDLRGIIAAVLYPLERAAEFPVNSIQSLTKFGLSYADLQHENVNLRVEARKLKVELLTYRALVQENAHLRQLLRARERYFPHVSTADIIFIGKDPFSRKILIDRGLGEGIHSGEVVVDDIGVLGQVTQVYPTSSEVSLITDKDEAVPVQVLRNGLRAIVFGSGNEDELNLPYMDANADIKVGDVLVTSGIDGVYPAGLPVGVVEKIDRSPELPFATIHCIPSAGTERNRQVFILTGPPPVNPPADVPKAVGVGGPHAGNS